MTTISYTSAQYKKRTLREVALGYSDENTTPPAEMVYMVINSRGVGLNPAVTTLVTQGTIERFSDDEPQSYSITLDQDVYENAMNDMWLAKTTTSLTDQPFTLASRYHGTGTPDQTSMVEVRLKVEMYNINTGAKRTEYIRFPKCRPQQYNPLGSGAQAEALIPQQVILDAQRTITDLAAETIVGAVAPGDFYVIDVLS